MQQECSEIRKNRVLNQLIQMTDLIVNQLNTSLQVGFSTKDIALQLNLLRNNVSMELNILVREKKAIKVAGKPVLYLAVCSVEKAVQIHFESVAFPNVEAFKSALGFEAGALLSLDKISQKVVEIKQPLMAKVKNKHKLDPAEGILEKIIGVHDDLQTQIKQAKAAILYPPNGLHTLLIGPTGSGKTTFAGVMHQYAIESGKLPKEAPYVIFNCADYAENKQLLISQLFGCIKGAYTGAGQERRGLVDKANGGILFLDEIHRLPPEGQEMLFSLIDRGTYQRLGETDQTHFANVLIIAATTENPESAILRTFLRRIPLTIALPGINERPLKVRMLLICQFFREESMKIKVPLTVAKEVLKVLLLYKCPGNIGQLRNDIQLICANAFIEYVTAGTEGVQIKLSQLTDQLKEGFFSLDEKRQEIMQNFNLNDCETITFNGSENDLNENLHDILLYDDYQMDDTFYEFILENAQKLYKKGCSIPEIKKSIRTKMQKRMHEIVPKALKCNLQVDKEVLSKLATPEIVHIIEEQLNAAPKLFGPVVDTKLIYSLALHMETLVERIRQGEITIYPNISEISNKYPDEYHVAKKIKTAVGEVLSINIPEDEVAFIGAFLYSIRHSKVDGNIQVLVMAHGQSTASNMVEVAKTLLGYDCLHALDMPMESKVEVTLQKAVEFVKRIHRGSGVLILVDMGSLTTFSEIITKKTGIPTKTIRMVSTPMVIEAARKAMMPNMVLDELVKSVITMSPFIGERIKITDMSLHEEEYREQKFPIQPAFTNNVFKMLENILVFLNVKKTYKILEAVLNHILADYEQAADEVIRLKFFFHCSCMLERVIRKEPLPYKNFIKVQKEKEHLFHIVKLDFVLAEESFGISIPNTEVTYVVEMLYLHFY
ncbi:Transcriptional regulator containing an AAA-type ATPase domain and a DNA-binding domain [Propionispira arboris]|uniref:Transcriptional regulator containing an AAA-type ATPase domain and a DNA-binding domain n=1 Tax=Propionispira arboris TaxID=84035 RepID=A0A1H6Z9H2_9FIRM|nr:sigma-54-dependent transcriptional regulator [Propionispira arboris]SEJ46322.1 Transcriptional regulator containing an AAA-type ATPase domain and a DNA-binding domain [Propionispira arboris]